MVEVKVGRPAADKGFHVKVEVAALWDEVGIVFDLCALASGVAKERGQRGRLAPVGKVRRAIRWRPPKQPGLSIGWFREAVHGGGAAWVPRMHGSVVMVLRGRSCFVVTPILGLLERRRNQQWRTAPPRGIGGKECGSMQHRRVERQSWEW